MSRPVGRSVKVRLIGFAVLAAVGITWIAGSYLGLVDRALGRNLNIHVTLPDSGGLFDGSEVTYRGVAVGRVEQVHVTEEGLRLDLTLEQGTEVPLDSKVYVHNLSAVGEQYLDFEPAHDEGPYAREGDVVHGTAESLPVGEDQLLIDLDELISSVDQDDLRTVIEELGAAFDQTGGPLQRLVDGTDALLREAIEHQDATFSLLDNGETVLATQADNRENITAFARDLADLTATVRRRDPELRQVLEGGSAAVREVDALMQGLEPTLPVFIGNLVTLNQIVTTRLSAIEQLLVTFPKIVAASSAGTPGDGYGHINLQFAQTPGPCREGYRPSEQWRPASDLTDEEAYPARCASGPPFNMRGSKYAPSFSDEGTANRVAPYDPATGVVDAQGDTPGVTVGSQGGLQDIFGDDAWRWMLIGPLEPS